MEFGRGVLILATLLQVADADTNITGRYTLPLSKVNIESCHREALLLHPGVIDEQRMLQQYGDYWVEYQIQAHDGPEWLVLCDLTTGKIIREQQLVDEVFK